MGDAVQVALTRAASDLDQLLRDASAGPRGQREYHRQEAEAQRIAAAIVAAYRGKRQ